MLELLAIILLNPLSILACIAVAIAYFIPLQYMGLYVWVLLFLISIFTFPFNQPYEDLPAFAFIAELLINSAVSIMAIGILIVVIIRVPKYSWKKHFRNYYIISILTAIAYGILAAYHLFLILSSLLQNLQPAWIAYCILVIVVLFITIGCSYIKKIYQDPANFYRDRWNVFTYSLCFTTLFISIISSCFSAVAYRETDKIIKSHQNKKVYYCIQIPSTRGYKPASTWLDITPLTAWNKPKRDWEAGRRHAVLIVKSADDRSIYYWSYKLRKWEYNSAQFEPYGFNTPSALECVPQKHYLNKLPFIFPK